MKGKLFIGLFAVILSGLSGCEPPGPPIHGDGEFLVRFFNYDESILYQTRVDYDEPAVYEGPTPTRPDDDLYSYTFAGWDQDIDHIYSNLDVHAVYDYELIGGMDPAEYDEWCDSWAEEGHLYIHYLRPGSTNESYDDYAIWLWQKAPQNLEGTLWGADNPSVLEHYHAMSNGWMTNIGGEGSNIVQSGRIMDIDLTRSNIIAGRTGSPVSFDDATSIGFLIMQEDSMGGETHWVSDGGADTFINDFQTHWRENGAMHIFCVQGNVANYTFEYSKDIEVNPVISDTTGQYRSTSNVDSSTDSFGMSPTAEEFKDLGVGYQIFVASFADSNGDGMGDIRGIINSLDYLDDLGVQVLWLTPVQLSNSYHGYDIVDYYQIDPKFGTLDDYRELLYEAHARGMKVLMDLVLNHTSKNNVWFQNSQRAVKGVDPYGNEINYRDLYHWKYEGDLVDLYQNGYYTKVAVENHPDWYRDGESHYYYYGKFGSGMAELNYDCQATRDLVINMAKYWLAFGVDGFRLDAVKHIYMRDEVDDYEGDIIMTDTGTRTYYDTETMQEETVAFDYSSDMTKNVNFWKEFNAELKAIDPHCYLVGENLDGWGARIAPYYQAIDSQLDFSLYYHTQEYLYRRTAGVKASGAGQKQNTETYSNFGSAGTSNINGIRVPKGNRPDYINAPFTSNHDLARAINSVNDETYDYKVTITGTSEQINRAKVHAAAVMLNPGISFIYYGDELGMSGNLNKHIELYDYANNEDMWYRQPFKWGGENESMTVDYQFDQYHVEWDDYNARLADSEAQANDSNSMLNLYKALAEIKGQYGRFISYQGYQGKIDDLYEFAVTTENGTFHVYINAGYDNQTTSVSVSGQVWALNGASSSGSLPPYGIIVTKS